MSKDTDDVIEQTQVLSDFVASTTTSLLDKGFDPIVLASVLLQQALFVCRNVLTPVEYDDYCKYVYETRLNIPMLDEQGNVVSDQDTIVTPSVKRWMN